MEKYIVVVTLCDRVDIANKIIERLLEKKLVEGSQMTKINSKL